MSAFPRQPFIVLHEAGPGLIPVHGVGRTHTHTHTKKQKTKRSRRRRRRGEEEEEEEEENQWNLNLGQTPVWILLALCRSAVGETELSETEYSCLERT